MTERKTILFLENKGTSGQNSLQLAISARPSRDSSRLSSWDAGSVSNNKTVASLLQIRGKKVKAAGVVAAQLPVAYFKEYVGCPGYILRSFRARASSHVLQAEPWFLRFRCWCIIVSGWASCSSVAERSCRTLVADSPKLHTREREREREREKRNGENSHRFAHSRTLKRRERSVVVHRPRWINSVVAVTTLKKKQNEERKKERN